MKLSMHFRPLIAAFTLGGLCAFSSHAAVVIYVQQSGVDVVASASGTLNTVALTLFSGASNGGDVAGTAWGGPGASALSVGAIIAMQSAWNGNITGPFPFSTGDVFLGSSGGGDPVGIAHLAGSTVLYTTVGYTSGSPLAGNTTWDNTTISALGMMPGSYLYTWGSGASADSLTINIVPEPNVIAIAVAGAVATLLRRRRGC